MKFSFSLGNFNPGGRPGDSQSLAKQVGSSSWSEKAILGALGEFRGIVGATLGIQKVILGVRNSILGMACHDLNNAKTIILRATPGAIPGTDGNGSPHQRF